MKKVAVSGLTGMIGKNIVSQYARDLGFRDSVELVALTRPDSNTSFLEQNRIEYRRIDYADAGSFAGALEDIDGVLHLAGLTKAVTPGGYYRANVDSTTCLLDALSRHGTRIRHFIFVSSISAAGPAAFANQPKTEEDPCTPLSHYGRSKLRAEALVRTCPFAWTIIRFPVVFGPYDHDVLSMFRFAKSGRIFLFADPQDPYSYASAPDVGHFLLKAMGDKRLYGEVFNYCYDTPMSGSRFFPEVPELVGLPQSYRYFQVPRWVACPARVLLEIKQRLTGRAEILNPDKIAELAARYWLVTNRKLKRVLGTDTIKNDRAIAETVEWYQQHHLL